MRCNGFFNELMAPLKYQHFRLSRISLSSKIESIFTSQHWHRTNAACDHPFEKWKLVTYEYYFFHGPIHRLLGNTGTWPTFISQAESTPAKPAHQKSYDA